MKDQKRTVQTSLQGIANKAERQKGYRFRNLYGMLNEEMLIDSWRYIRKEAAYGVDNGYTDFQAHLDTDDHLGSDTGRNWFGGGTFQRGKGSIGRWGYQPWRTSCCKRQSSGYWKRSMSKTF